MRSNKELIDKNKILAEEGLKCCISCNNTKSLCEFFCRKVFKLGGYSPKCKLCYVDRKEKLQIYNQRRKTEKDIWRKNNLSKMNFSKMKHVLKKYGATIENYLDQKKIQNDSCAICKTKEIDLDRRLVIDHCHKTMNFRGLLCDRCNRAIGQFEDNVDLLQSAINYINN